MELLYEGKGKKLFSTANEHHVIAFFKDDLTAFNAQKTSVEEGKGKLNCEITSRIFMFLQDNGIPTHFIKKMSDNEILCERVRIIPIEVVVRNIATGSITKRLGIQEGIKLPELIELYYKNDALGDPIINDEHALLLGCVDNALVLDELRSMARKINSLLMPFFMQRNLILVDFKLEFGIDTHNNLLLADEITPDSCRFWDSTSHEKLDKDRFRNDLGNIKMAYEEVSKRLHS